MAKPADEYAAGPTVRPPTGVNGPTIFTGAGERQRIDRALPFGPNGGVHELDNCTVPQGGPTCDHR